MIPLWVWWALGVIAVLGVVGVGALLLFVHAMKLV